MTITTQDGNQERRNRAVTNTVFCCPEPGATLWSSHPRIYLKTDNSGSATCPYCGAKYFAQS